MSTQVASGPPGGSRQKETGTLWRQRGEGDRDAFFDNQCYHHLVQHYCSQRYKAEITYYA